MADPTPEVYAAAADAYRGELQMGEWHAAEPGSLRAAVDAVWRIAEREIRAKVAAELRAALTSSARPPWAVIGNVYRAASVAEWAARIAEGGDTDGR